jgi:hypothetical protein
VVGGAAGKVVEEAGVALGFAKPPVATTPTSAPNTSAAATRTSVAAVLIPPLARGLCPAFVLPPLARGVRPPFVLTGKRLEATRC